MTDDEKMLEALNRLFEWDAKRGYIVPYKVRDPLADALISLKTRVLQAKVLPSPKLHDEHEHAAFETWRNRVCPSGDVESVQRQWEDSYDFADYLRSKRDGAYD